jgi:hypothetical protein
MPPAVAAAVAARRLSVGRLPDIRPKSDVAPPAPAGVFERPRCFRLIVTKIEPHHRLWRSIGLEASAYKPDEAYAFYSIDAEPQLLRHVAMLREAGYHGRIKQVIDTRSEAFIRSDQARKSYSIRAVQLAALNRSKRPETTPEPPWRIRALAPNSKSLVIPDEARGRVRVPAQTRQPSPVAYTPRPGLAPARRHQPQHGAGR